MKKTNQTMANYESVKPIIKRMMLDHDLSMAQLSVLIGKSSSYISNSSRFGLTDRAKKQLLLLLQGISNRGVIANDLLKIEMELTKSLKVDISHLKNKLYMARNHVELAFIAGIFLLMNFIGFLHAIAVILNGNVGIYDLFIGASNVLGVIFFVCILEDILIDLED